MLSVGGSLCCGLTGIFGREDMWVRFHNFKIREKRV
jgi:hypothetical protein